MVATAICQAPASPNPPTPSLPDSGCNTGYQSRTAPFEEARNIATVFAALVGILPFFLIFLNLKASQQTTRARVSLDALALFEGRDGENLLLEGLVKDARLRQVPFDINELSPKDRETLHQLARAWDMAGLLVKQQVMPTSVLFDFYSHAIVRAWRFLQGMVEEERQNRGQQGYMRKFEVIAIGAALYRLKIKNEPLQFEIDKEAEAEWKHWEKKAWK